MIRATAILRGLSHNLDFDKGGDVAEGLHTTYHTLIMACLRSFGRPNSAECYRRIMCRASRELRDASICGRRLESGKADNLTPRRHDRLHARRRS